MKHLENRIEYLEESYESLHMQNRVLAAALKGLLRSLPQELSAAAIESIKLAFDEEIASLEYEENPQTDLFYDATYDFFKEREH